MRVSSPSFVSIRQHTSAYVSIRQHTSAYVSIRQHTQCLLLVRERLGTRLRLRTLCQRPRLLQLRCVSICTFVLVNQVNIVVVKQVKLSAYAPAAAGLRARRCAQHASAYVSIRQHTSAYAPAAAVLRARRCVGRPLCRVPEPVYIYPQLTYVY
jgi:hypothetical protein